MNAKKGLQALSLLLIVALAGAMFVPAVSAIDIETVEKYSVSQKDAFIGAEIELNKFINDGVMSKDEYSVEMLKNDPVLLYDANGLLLYYQFPIEKNGKNVGYIRASASKVLGGTVSIIQDSPDNNDYDELLAEAIKSFEKELSSSEEIADAKFIGYDFSFLGVMLTIMEKDGSIREVILDSKYKKSYDSTEKGAELDQFSLYTNLDSTKVDEKIKLWEAQSKEIAVGTKAAEFKDLWNEANLIQQPNDYWCAVTTGKMIGYWFGASDSFDDIAEIMDSVDEYGNPVMTPSHYEELDYYSNDPNGLQLDCLYRSLSQVIYSEGKNQIKNNENPISSTVPSGNNMHTRALAGYYQTTSSNYFRLYDPAASQRSWENFDTTDIREWILVGW